MRDLFRMWKYTNMIALTAISAGIYIAALIPFKSISLIEGFTEIRPASLFPILFGLLFGPAGAWGSAIGNLIADLFGTFSKGSIFGFAGNFLYAYIPYKIWGNLELFYMKDKKDPNIDSGKKLIIFGITAAVSSVACALVISWGTDALKLVPFARLSSIIILNNTVVNMLLGPLILPFLYPRIKKMGLLWTDIMSVEDISVSEFPKFYSYLVIFSAIGGLAAGLITSLLFTDQTVFAINQSIAGGSGNIIVSLSVLPFIIIMFYGVTKL